MDWGLIGHTWAVDLLAQHIARGQERHAYLITGPQGVGRRTLALRFAQGLNCPTPAAPGKPCLTCPSCRRIEAMQHPDLAVVQSESEGETLRIDQVRELQHSLALAPYEARYRIALILRFEEAHPSAANAMLKTLEEPPPQVVVLLTARSVESVLPTIVSRCEVIRLRPLSLEQTAHGLETIRGLPHQQAELLAHISDGRPGYALRLFSNPQLLAQRAVYMQDLFQLLASTKRERFAFVVGRLNDKDALLGELQLWLSFWRDVLILASGLGESITNVDYAEQLKQLAGQVGRSAAHDFVAAIENTLDRIDHNVNLRLALEVLVMDFPRITGISISA
jgi:DNA polymerase-3 subunit delta'